MPTKASPKDDDSRVAERMLKTIFKDHTWTDAAARARCIKILQRAEKLVLLEMFGDGAAAQASRAISRASEKGPIEPGA